MCVACVFACLLVRASSNAAATQPTQNTRSKPLKEVNRGVNITDYRSTHTQIGAETTTTGDAGGKQLLLAPVPLFTALLCLCRSAARVRMQAIARSVRRQRSHRWVMSLMRISKCPTFSRRKKDSAQPSEDICMLHSARSMLPPLYSAHAVCCLLFASCTRCVRMTVSRKRCN